MPMAHSSAARDGEGAAEVEQWVVPGLQEECRRSEEMSVFLNGDGAHDTVPELPWSREAYTRIILQALQELGYRRSAMELEAEAGVQVNSKEVKLLEKAVMDGDFVGAEKLLEAMGLEEAKVNRCRFMLRRHKYLELLEQDDYPAAMHCLQTDITPLGHDPATIHALAALVVCQGPTVLKQKAQWAGAGAVGRHELLKAVKGLLPQTVLLAPHRLQTLTQQALQHQMEHCVRYNLAEPWADLLQDCYATEERIPSQTVMRLDHHGDEVWFVQFSHCGKRLASASKDRTIAVWALDQERPAVVKVLTGHQDSVSFLAWSHDDTRMLSCGNDCTIKLWDMEAAVCLRNFLGHSEPVTALAWLPYQGGKRFVSGGCDKKIFTWQVDSTDPIAEHHGERVGDLALSADGSRMVTISPDKRIRIFDLPHMHESTCVADQENLTSLSLSADGRYLLVNVSSDSRPEIQLWDLEEKLVVRKFSGHKQGRYVIRSCFGGVRDMLVVCGSEDSQVYIWHRATGALLRTLQGHAGTINSVAWCPTDPRMFASGSDDNTVRVWGCPPPAPQHSMPDSGQAAVPQAHHSLSRR